MEKKTKIGVYLDPNDEDNEFENRLVSAKELGGYCGLSISTISRLGKDRLKRHVVNIGRKKLYKLGRSMVSLMLYDSLTDAETKKFNDQCIKRMKLHMKFLVYEDCLISEQDAIVRYDIESSRVQECIDNGLDFINKEETRVFIPWEIAEHADLLKGDDKIKRYL